MNTQQVRFLLALIANLQGLPLTHYNLPRDDKEDIYLVNLDGGPKIYIKRSNRQSFYVNAHGYAFHGRDAIACFYMIGLATVMGATFDDVSKAVPTWWEQVKVETTRLASGMVPA